MWWPFRKKSSLDIPKEKKQVASSLDMSKPEKKTTKKKRPGYGIPENVKTAISRYRFERTHRDPAALEREIREIVGWMLIYRTEDTPKGSREDEGVPNPVEFIILDTEEQHVEKDTAETLGKAQEWGHIFASQRGVELVPHASAFYPRSDGDSQPVAFPS